MEEPEDSITVLQKGAQVLGVALNGEHLARFQVYTDLLRLWSTRINLLGPAALRQLWERHLLDALTLIPALPPGMIEGPPRSLIDVGSGGGIPGMPLAILLPRWPITLLEATSKKARFLETVADELALEEVRVVQGRAEEVGHQDEHREAYDLCVARAVTHTAALVELTLPFVTVHGAAYYYKGLNGLGEEIEAAEPARRILGAASPTILPLTALPDTARCLVCYVKIAQAPAGLPRRAGLPERQPLTAVDGARIGGGSAATRDRRR